MKSERRIIVSIATSVDGYIARKDGGVEWLDRPRPKDNYGMAKFFASIDTILWGRKTYRMALDLAGESLGVGPRIQNYIFSRRPQKTSSPRVEFVREPIADFARRLRSRPGKDIFMMGGAGIIASFLDAGQIDELRIHVVPVLIGEGIPLIAPAHRQVPLKLLSEKRFPDGVVQLCYDVAGRTREPRPKSGR